ncbi:MAG: DNA-processing protein DprA [Kofleriaceae bacterium]
MGQGERWAIEPGQPGSPERLTALARPPTVRGVGPVPTGPAVALVGSRAAAATAMATAAALAARAVARGAWVVSGGALGIDAAAHRGALAAGGRTAVVVGTGLDVVYPERNAGLFAAVVTAGGALVSTFADGAPPRRGHFVARNTVIAALVDLVVVVAAEPRSGSLHTARAATRLGTPVAAVPGTAGADALIAAGAGVIAAAADLDAALAGQPRRPGRPPLDDDEAAAWAALDPCTPRTPLELAAVLGVRPAAAWALLDGLVAAGWAAPRGDAFVRVA